MQHHTLVHLFELSARLRLPASWLKAEAVGGRIPCLQIGRRLLFDLAAVERALAQRAASAPERGSAQ